jgi:hypothetical protein
MGGGYVRYTKAKAPYCGFGPGNSQIKLTDVGGIAVWFINKTGGASVQGRTVKADAANDFSVVYTGLSDQECIGVFLDSGVPDGAGAWVVYSGKAYVAMEDNTAATHSYWVKTSDNESGYANATLAAPPGGGVVQLDQHMQEMGHCFESVAAGGAGTHILALCILHFN